MIKKTQFETPIFNQGIFSLDEIIEARKNLKLDIAFSFFSKEQRIISAEMVGNKFGFVIKNIKTLGKVGG